MRNHLRTILVSLSAVLVLVVGTVVGTNLVTADTPSSSAVTVTFNYNGATGGTSVTTATVTSGTQADDFLPLPTKPGESFTGWFNTQSLLNGQRITTIGEGDTGELLAGFVPPELTQTLKLVLPSPPPPTCANGLATCVIGNIGPGGGLVFLISGGKTYEMAPKSWGVNETTGVVWTTTAAKCYAFGGSTEDRNCQENSVYPGTDIVQTTSRSEAAAIGMGSANTDAIIARMDAGGVASGTYAAGAARAYPGGGYNDWYLPSRDELNAMCNYSRTWVGAPLTGACTGLQNADFASSNYGFVTSQNYWSSSERDPDGPWYVGFVGGSQGSEDKGDRLVVRPIRAF